jgi:hypothetical protein
LNSQPRAYESPALPLSYLAVERHESYHEWGILSTFMSAEEIVVNLHMHTCYSDGSGLHREIAEAGLDSGLDVVIVTDHNVYVQGVEGYYRRGPRRVLLLVGEEVHDRYRLPQKDHLLVFGVGQSMSDYASDPQGLIDAVRERGGLSFIAHPFDPEAPAVNEVDISWVDWEVKGYTGLELWNAFSEFKTRIKSKIHALFYAFFPHLIARGPLPETLQKWDELLLQGKRTVAIGGSDAHALRYAIGPLRKTIFPYRFHFSAVNTHLLLSQPLSGDMVSDRRLVYEALAQGRGWIGYDLPSSTRGFRFTARGKERTIGMGEEMSLNGGVTLQARLPSPAAEIRLLRDGEVIRTWKNQYTCAHIVTEPGVYRLEAYRFYRGRKRGWIFSNPIYLR